MSIHPQCTVRVCVYVCMRVSVHVCAYYKADQVSLPHVHTVLTFQPDNQRQLQLDFSTGADDTVGNGGTVDDTSKYVH